LFPCLIASFAASYTSHALGLEKFGADLNCSLKINTYLFLKLALLGVLFGIIGGLFAYSMNLSKKFLSKRINNPILRIFIVSCILSVLLLLLHEGRYAGSGTNLIEASLFNKKIYGYDWLVKFILTILTMSAGFQVGGFNQLI